MELSEVLMKRRSVRKFTEEPVTGDEIDALMHAAMSGPSACNKNPWEFYVVTNPEKLEQLRSAAHYSRIKAPLSIVVVGCLAKALPRDMAAYWVQDCSAATENILLKAVDLGLGAVWCGIHPQKQAEANVAAVLGLTDDRIPLNIIHIGHPAETPAPGDRYEAQNVILMR